MGIPSPDQSYLPGLPKYLSFVDESGHSADPNRNCMCLAGLIAAEASWRAFDADWRTACAEEGLTEAFHMMHLSASKAQFKGWSEERRRGLLRRLVGAISKAQAIPIGSVVMLKGPGSLSGDVQKQYRDAHFIAFQSLTFNIAVAAHMMGPFGRGPGPVTMVYAHHPEHSNGLSSTGKLWQAFRENNRIVALFMDSHVSDTPKDCTPLQAADLWAYELGHHFERIRPLAKKPRWPFRQFVSLGLNYKFSHDFISYHGTHGLSGLGKMSRAQRLGEIDLYRPGFVGVHPADARKFDTALRKIAAGMSELEGNP
jgi:Protein of unknown function (DUF3800)